MEFNDEEVKRLQRAIENYLGTLECIKMALPDEEYKVVGDDIDNYRKLLDKISSSTCDIRELQRKENGAILLYNKNWYTGKAILIPDKKMHRSPILQSLVLNDSIRLNIPIYVRAKSVKTRLIQLMNDQYNENCEKLVVCESDKGHGGVILLHPYAKPYDIQKLKERGYKIANGFVSRDDIL